MKPLFKLIKPSLKQEPETVIGNYIYYKRPKYQILRTDNEEYYDDESCGIDSYKTFNVDLNSNYKEWLNFDVGEIPKGVCLDITLKVKKSNPKSFFAIARKRDKIYIIVNRYCFAEDAYRAKINPYKVLSMTGNLLKQKNVKTRPKGPPASDGSYFLDYIFTCEPSGNILQMAENSISAVEKAMDISKKNLVRELVMDVFGKEISN